jgi:hypothetical protein
MPDSAPNAELLRSLGRLVRGLSALFWGLPIALIVFVWTANPQWLKSFDAVPPLVATGLLLFALVSTGLLVFGLWQLAGFQPQERVWRSALDRATILGLINFGLSPFLYFSIRFPDKPFFTAMVILLEVSALFFLGSLNVVLQRLGAMLPDEALRVDTRQFTTLNLNLLLATLLFGVLYLVVAQLQPPSGWLRAFAALIERGGLWFLIPLVLLPLAMTMALLWKTKEVILDNVFGPER